MRATFTTQTGRMAQSLARNYRCVYCYQHYAAVGDLLAHEQHCAYRALRRLDWAHRIERFRLRRLHQKLELKGPA